jgi:hypothetical protein
MKDRALDVFPLLERLDRKDYQIWETLTPEQQKEFSPFILLRWMAGTLDPLQLIFLNEIVNGWVFEMGEHKELFMKLLAICSNGKPKRYSWVNYKITGQKKTKLSVKLLMDFYDLSEADATDTRRLFSPEELLDLAMHAGWQKDEISDLKKELKNGS